MINEKRVLWLMNIVAIVVLTPCFAMMGYIIWQIATHQKEWRAKQSVCEDRCGVGEVDAAARWTEQGCKCTRTITIKCSWDGHGRTDTCDLY